jgi:hypothetical protein
LTGEEDAEDAEDAAAVCCVEISGLLDVEGVCSEEVEDGEEGAGPNV